MRGTQVVEPITGAGSGSAHLGQSQPLTEVTYLILCNSSHSTSAIDCVLLAGAFGFRECGIDASVGKSKSTARTPEYNVTRTRCLLSPHNKRQMQDE